MNNYWYIVLVYYLTSFNIPRYFYVIFNEKDMTNIFISDGIKRPKYKKISKILWEKTNNIRSNSIYQMGCPPFFNSIKELVEIISSTYLTRGKYITYSWFRVKEINIKHEYKNIYKIKRE